MMTCAIDPPADSPVDRDSHQRIECRIAPDKNSPMRSDTAAMHSQTGSAIQKVCAAVRRERSGDLIEQRHDPLVLADDRVILGLESHQHIDGPARLLDRDSIGLARYLL